jgi:hypothetical protein
MLGHVHLDSFSTLLILISRCGMAASPGSPNVLLSPREDALSVHGQVEVFHCCLCGILLTVSWLISAVKGENVHRIWKCCNGVNWGTFRSKWHNKVLLCCMSLMNWPRGTEPFSSRTITTEFILLSGPRAGPSCCWPAEIVGSNPTGDKEVCLLWALWVVW